MIVTLPLPVQVTQSFPEPLVTFLSWFAFYTFSALLAVPWLFCIFQLIVHNVGRQPRMTRRLDDNRAPKCVVVMPCYKEDPDVLLTAINSIVGCDYPSKCLHIFLSFDGDQVDELYKATLSRLGIPELEKWGVEELKEYPTSIDHIYEDVRITISRFPHGGKRKCQKHTFKLVDRIYADYQKHKDDMFILFIDSDCILDNVCIQNFLYEMELKPGARGKMLAMTGVITSTTKSNSLITILQDMEYVHGQVYERAVESGCGAVTCLPGALTMLRFSAFRKMAKYYFADNAEQMKDLFDYGKNHLGEDRWLTHLFMIGAKKPYQIQMCTGAFCKTEAVQTFKSLLKQRRRWFLGYITNEVCMLTDARLWMKYPLLCIVRFMQNTIRTTALLFFAMLVALAVDSGYIRNLPLGFLGVSLGLTWALMIYLGIKLGRFKIWLYPLMFLLNPWFNWMYLVYGICTAGQRTWGGPRADAAAADKNTSPQEAIEHAEEAGDDLNVDLETFRPAVKAAHPGWYVRDARLHPSPRLDGRFAAAEESPGGLYLHPSTESDLSLPSPILRSRASLDSTGTRSSGVPTIDLPEYLTDVAISDEDLRKHQLAQRASRGSGVIYDDYKIPANHFYAYEDNGHEAHRDQHEGADDNEEHKHEAQYEKLKAGAYYESSEPEAHFGPPQSISRRGYELVDSQGGGYDDWSPMAPSAHTTASPPPQNNEAEVDITQQAHHYSFRASSRHSSASVPIAPVASTPRPASTANASIQYPVLHRPLAPSRLSRVYWGPDAELEGDASGEETGEERFEMQERVATREGSRVPLVQPLEHMGVSGRQEDGEVGAQEMGERESGGETGAGEGRGKRKSKWWQMSAGRKLQMKPRG